MVVRLKCLWLTAERVIHDENMCCSMQMILKNAAHLDKSFLSLHSLFLLLQHQRQLHKLFFFL